MIIKDYYINTNIDNIVNQIILYLIKNNINYLYIKKSNELHFDNYILRFKNNINIKKFIFYDFFNLLNTISKNTYNEYYDDKDFTIHDNNQKNKFKNIKKIENIKINNIPKTKTLKKQLYPTRKIYK